MGDNNSSSADYDVNADWDKNNLLALVQARDSSSSSAGVDWAKVTQRIATSVQEEAFLTDPLTKRNALHYVMEQRRSCPDLEQLKTIVKAILAENPEAATACEAANGFTPLAMVCDSTPENYLNKDAEQCEAFLQQDAELVALLHKENDLAMDVPSKQGLPPLAVHMAALSRVLRLHPDLSVDVSVSPFLELLLEKSSLEDCGVALHTLCACNLTKVTAHYLEEEERARNGLPSQGLEEFGWWLLDAVVQLLFCAHSQLWPGQTITNFSPLQTLCCLPNPPIALFFIVLRASSPSELQKPDKGSLGNLPIHNVASWDLPAGDPVTRKSIALTALLKAYPDAEQMRNKDGETPTDLYYRMTNTTTGVESK